MSEGITMKVSLSADSKAFLRRWRAEIEPYDVSPSTLLDWSLRIVQHLHSRGELDLSLKALRELFGEKSA